jgi:hypothetical protein
MRLHRWRQLWRPLTRLFDLVKGGLVTGVFDFDPLKKGRLVVQHFLKFVPRLGSFSLGIFLELAQTGDYVAGVHLHPSIGQRDLRLLGQLKDETDLAARRRPRRTTLSAPTSSSIKRCAAKPIISRRKSASALFPRRF